MIKSGNILALIILCFTGLFDTAYQATPLPAFEEEASDYLADVRERATYAYAAARTLNAAISLLKSVDAGIGFVSLQPGHFLEPINDMIEQFSDLVLIALASVGIQEILVAILGDISWRYLLPLSLLPALLAPWSKRWCNRLNSLSATLVISIIMIRLLIPSIALGGHMITTHYLTNDYNAAIQHVDKVKDETNKAILSSPRVSQPLPPKVSTPGERSVFSNPKYEESATIIPDWDTVKKLADSDQIIAMLDNVPDRIITLITIFAFETLALPLLMVFIFLWVGRGMLTLFKAEQSSPDS